MSSAVRTNESATKSASSSAASVQVGEVLLRDRGQLRAGVGDVDALARGQRPRRHHARDDLAVRHALDREARHAVADDDLRALGDQRGEVREVDAHAIGRLGAAAAAEDDRLARLQHARRGVGGQPQLRALQVEQQPERAPGSLGRRAHRRRPAGAGRRACRASSSAARSRRRPRRAGPARRADRSRARAWPRSSSSARTWAECGTRRRSTAARAGARARRRRRARSSAAWRGCWRRGGGPCAR